MAPGEFHCLALKADGTVVAWGSNEEGQCNVPPGLSNVVAIAAGSDHSVAAKADGTIVGWGAGSPTGSVDSGQATAPTGLTNVVALAAGAYYTVALWADHTRATPRFSATRKVNNTYDLNLFAEAGRPSDISVSTNLQTWEPLVSVTNRTGRVHYVDTNAAGLTNRFFRAATR